MRRVLIDSNSTRDLRYDLDNSDALTPVEIAEKLGRCEFGEMVRVWDGESWDDEITDRPPDHQAEWNQEDRCYVETAPFWNGAYLE